MRSEATALMSMACRNVRTDLTGSHHSMNILAQAWLRIWRFRPWMVSTGASQLCWTDEVDFSGCIISAGRSTTRLKKSLMTSWCNPTIGTSSGTHLSCCLRRTYWCAKSHCLIEAYSWSSSFHAVGQRWISCFRPRGRWCYVRQLDATCTVQEYRGGNGHTA